MSEPLVQYKIEDFIAHVTLNNPPMNPLIAEAKEALREVFLELEERNDHVRAVVLSGGGDKAFVAGADIKAFLDLTPETALSRLNNTHQIFSLVENYRWPVIAAIQGFCLGGGLELALCCDIRYAAADAVLGFPEVNLSIFPGNGGMARALHFLGLGRFKELVYSGRRITAAEAYEYGLVEKVVPHEELMAEAMGLAKSIAKRGPLGVAGAKKVINQTRDLAVEQALSVESQNWSKLAATQDMKEGAKAFVEKRKPIYHCR
ncbi:MAG: enoyl-CoA hydratase/isomerase family protein [Desulfarculaceae bacterium]|nr:enoyl-CoA hydratase/isomerase family protein [Desulfarculaceae bacterium]MCF8046696.1 enoyl-CoA hydratase/isomerase family protein [Desulfarculaceae bacterium]MCF8098233.1 enoyl-CoA hydratase/isomerase family protein [Desulfarculaceae bacterium]MCF8121547.1 enoyl-CoA hydratase/isomerase family protein [Desulfarculaceae bacterium]